MSQQLSSLVLVAKLVALVLARQQIHQPLDDRQPMCRVSEQRAHGAAPLNCSGKRRPMHLLHMRKAGGTSVRENLRTACGEQWLGLEESEWVAYNWARRSSDASRIVSLRPPLERLLSSYLFEGGHA